MADIVTATYLGKGRTRIQSGERDQVLSQRTYLDELGAGLCPVELVAASLAGWMVLTIAAVADAKGIALECLSARVQMQVDQAPGRPAFTRFATEVHLDGALSDRERTILFNSARRCEVHRLLQGEVEFEERLVEG